ncbi:hypothetical protein HY78_02410 [Rhizorhabdus wittichii DC-6]|nr:hypothetical protein HY78_02410 [Rhizorhabdus wittichii DC-6]
MSFISRTVASPGKVPLPLAPSLVSASLQARDGARSLAEDNWENEGGQLAGANAPLVALAPLAKNVESLEAQLHLMENTLFRDFSNGLTGTRYNSYEHRSRVLRQQKARLDAMRASFQAQGQ